MSAEGYVYIISDGEKCKVGFSANPAVRIKTLTSFYKMEVTNSFISDFSDYALKIEGATHKKLNKFIIPDMGREWFLVDFDEAVKAVESIDDRQFEQAKFNEAQFYSLAKELKVKPERLQAVKDVIFTDATATPTEVKYGLVRGTVQRDVDRVNNLYDWVVNLPE